MAGAVIAGAAVIASAAWGTIAGGRQGRASSTRP